MHVVILLGSTLARQSLETLARNSAREGSTGAGGGCTGGGGGICAGGGGGGTCAGGGGSVGAAIQIYKKGIRDKRAKRSNDRSEPPRVTELQRAPQPTQSQLTAEFSSTTALSTRTI